MSSPEKISNGKEIGKRPYQKFMDRLAERIAHDSTGNAAFDIAANVIDQIMNSNTMEEVFAANENGPQDMEEFLGRPLTIESFRAFKSDEKYASGVGGFLVMEAITDLGETLLVSSGAPNVVATVFRAEELGKLPIRLVIKGKGTGNGTLHIVTNA